MIITKRIIEIIFFKPPRLAVQELAEEEIRGFARAMGLEGSSSIELDMLIRLTSKRDICLALYRTWLGAESDRDIWYALLETEEIYGLCRVFGLGEFERKKEGAKALYEKISQLRDVIEKKEDEQPAESSKPGRKRKAVPA